MRLPKFSLGRRKEEIRTCGDCQYFDESSSYCKKLWAPVVSETRACKHYRPRPVKEVVGAEHS